MSMQSAYGGLKSKFALISLLLFLSVQTGSSQIIWLDRFEDNTLNDWKVYYGLNWTDGKWREIDPFVSASNERMVFSAPNKPSIDIGASVIAEVNQHSYLTKICHTNAIVIGHWSFDIKLGASQTPTWIHFISDEKDIIGSESPYFDPLSLFENSYILGLGETGSKVTLRKGNITLGEKQYHINPAKFVHVDITRSSQGQFNVFIDGKKIISKPDDSLISLKFLCLYSNNAIFDNIEVNDDYSFIPIKAELQNYPDVSNQGSFYEIESSDELDSSLTLSLISFTFILMITRKRIKSRRQNIIK